MGRRPIAFAFAAILVIAQVGTAFAAAAATTRPDSAASAAAKIDKTLSKTLEKGATRFIVEFAAKADLRGAAKQKTHAGKAKFVFDALTATAKKSQAAALAVVKGVKNAEARSYWLTNSLIVTGDAKLAAKLAALKEVSSVHPTKIYPLVKPVEAKAAILAAAGDPEWGVEKIGADQVWAQGILGSGITVANVDTGVEFSHPALVEHYRGNNHDGSFSHDYNWWDPAGVCGGEPCDNVGHGTHTMGTMVGGDGPGPFTPDTGVAPGATWFAAKGCEDFGCTSESLISAGQFILAPTDLEGNNPNPALAAHVVNNSWGSDDPNDNFYVETVQAWRAASIIPVFSAGNSGPSCGSAGTPGNFDNVISVGATNIKDTIADFSSRGPSPSGKVSPNVSAPGADVVSSVPGGGYESFSGTSMAAPHTVGAIALMLSAKSALIGDYDAVLNALNVTAVDKPDGQCGSPDPSDNDPNYVYGEGRIDAKAAVDLVKTGGTLSGTVTDAAGGAPIGGARVIASNGDRDFAATTDATGDYSLFLAAGTYNARADAFGYEVLPAPGVVIVQDTNTDQDFALTALPRFTVSGTVTASEDGSAIEGASVKALGTPVVAATTNAAGAYSLELPIGDYTLRANAGGCTEVGTADISLVDKNITQDFGLFRKLDDFGHGCRPIAFDWVDAGTQSALFGDEFAGRLTLPFDFSFYGTSYHQVFLSDNGYINFLAADQYNSFPVAIPNTSTPNAAIYALWQDLFLDDSSSIDYATVGSAPNRAFVIEYSGVKAQGASARASFEVKLWENGSIDLVYGNNAASPGDGRNAGIGIENATGTDALQFSFLDDLLGTNEAYRFEHVATGIVHGTVTDANDHLPIAGAHVTAAPGGRTATTGADGTYSLRVRPGTYTLTAGMTYYVDGTAPATVTDGSDAIQDFALAASVASATPTTVNESVDYGGSASATVTLSNAGSGPLLWTAKERQLGVTIPPLPTPTSTVIRKHTWAKQSVPASFPRTKIADLPPVTLSPVVTDPAGDSLDADDVIAIRGGSDGSSVVGIGLDFSPTTPMNQIGGFLFLDTDQNASTGLPAEAFFGLPTQDVGMEYIVDLFGTQNSGSPEILVFDANTFELVADVPATIDDHSILFDIPLDALSGDDGFINVGLVVGLNAPSDWAPDTGHGTIQPFADLPWLSETPDTDSVAAGGDEDVTINMNGAGLTPGEYHALVVLVTNAPKQQQVPIDVTFTVTLPADFGALSGTVTDAHSGDPIGDVAVTVHAQRADSPLDLTTQTAGDGTWSVTGPEGTWPADFVLDGYVAVHRDVTIVRGVTTPGTDVGLHLIRPHAIADGGPFVFVLTPNRSGHGTVTLSNPDGHADLTFHVGEVDLDGATGSIAAAAAPTRLPTGGNSLARTTKGLFAAKTVAIPPSIRADGDVLSSFKPGMSLPWGVGYTGNVWLSDPIDILDAGFHTDGERIGQFDTPWAGNWPGDAAYDTARHLLWQVNVGGDNGIYGIDPTDGSVVQSITGSPWSGTSQRGLAYDPTHDVFYIGGWNEGIVYRVAGPTWTTPGATLSQCNPPDGAISGLAFNSSFQLLWEATNSDTDTIYLLDPITCEALRAIPHPDGGGFGGAGIETDIVGNLWVTGQNSGMAYNVESGLPNFSDVPWLSTTVTEGSVAIDGSTEIGIDVDSTGLAPGVYHAIVVIQTNDPANANIQVPVVLVVPAYQQGVNAGGAQYVNANGDVFAADRAYGAGAYGYVGASATKVSTVPIGGTTEDRLYQDLRTAMTSYRFDLANGHYRVDLGFAELLLKKAGGRVFSVSIEGQQVLSNLDVYATVGKDTALDRSFEVDVTDGHLDITFTPQRGDKPIVNSILVTEMPAGSPGAR
ncbi:MAG TPA: carboxypeptidase regulatory-like domain-containing protein [Candidatus Limnocylindrales bacterium]|nr:carboxypeptidase regulatory-like domain-containing protein [Candidatus Limnocylindrales bacterium]